jgi:hypothetical protein
VREKEREGEREREREKKFDPEYFLKNFFERFKCVSQSKQTIMIEGIIFISWSG